MSEWVIIVEHPVSSFPAILRREQATTFDEMMMSALYQINTFSWIFIVLAH